MSDLISRQAAIDALWSLDVEIDVILKRLKGLPSAQPDLNEWCTDCKEYDKEKHHCPRFNRVIREALKDAQPRKPGKWTIYDRHTIPYQYICSECGAYHRARYDFCPSCGADMRGKLNESV